MAHHDIEKLILQLPLAYSIQKLLFDENGVAVDYVFIHANPAFEKMTGLPITSILNKRVTEVLPNIRKGTFDWIAYYANLVDTGAACDFIQYDDNLERWYKVTAYATDTETFVTVFQDVSAEQTHLRELKRQKQEIQLLSRELELIFDNTQDAMLLLRVEKNRLQYVRSNLAHQRLTGSSPDTMPEEAILADYWQAYQAICNGSSDGLTCEESCQLPDGIHHWYKRLIPVYDQEGTITHLVETRTDITTLKALQHEKDELLQRFQAMFIGHNAIMSIVDPDTQQILDANPAACNFFGFTHEEAVSMRISDICLLPARKHAEAHKKILRGVIKSFLAAYRKKDGEIRLMEVFSSPVDYKGKQCLYSILYDVTDREGYREQLQQERDLLSITLKSIGDGVVTTDSDGRITMINRIAEKMTGWKRYEVEGKKFTDIFILQNENTGEIVQNPIEQVLTTGRQVGLANHTVLINKQGQAIPIADSAAPIKDKFGNMFGVVMVFRDVSLEKQHEKHVLYLSYHDILTGLYNRRYAEEQLQKLDAEQQLPLSVMMGDVNGLKITNDIFGHNTGDKLLQKIASTISECCREDVVVSRWGGDEILILLPQTPMQDAKQLMKKIQEQMKANSEGILHLSISFGCAVKQKPTEDIGTVLSLAEDRMYQKKLSEGKEYRKTIISIMLNQLEEKNSETAEHAERLKEHCLRMGQAMDLPEKDLEELSIFAKLHDIGKIGVRPAVLQKRTTLSPEEWDEIRQHSLIGYRIALNAPEFMPISEYILSHHERWDGTGYPRGLVETQIPLLSRMLAVADAYDAMTHDQIYRKAMSKTDAIRELTENAGTQFDPDMVKLFLHTLNYNTGENMQT